MHIKPICQSVYILVWFSSCNEAVSSIRSSLQRILFIMHIPSALQYSVLRYGWHYSILASSDSEVAGASGATALCLA